MEESQTSLNVQRLQYLLARRDHERFLAAFECADTPKDDFLQALGGEGLCLLLDEAEVPRNDWSNQYANLLLSRTIVAPSAAISRLPEWGNR